MKAAWRLVRAATIFLAAIIALSCNNAYGIFYNVQGEKAQTGTNTFQEVPVFSVFRFHNNYYASIATLQTSVVGQDNWSMVPIGSPPTTAYVLRAAVLVGNATTGTIYALIEQETSTSLTVSVYSSTDAATWTPVTLPPALFPSASNPLIDNFDNLFITSDGNLYAEDHSYNPNSTNPTNPFASTFLLYHYDPVGKLFSQVSTFLPGSASIRGVVFDGSNYWFAAEDLVCSGASSDGTGALPSSASFSGLALGAIWDISYTGGYVYVTTNNGYIYRNDGLTGANPTSAALTQVLEVPSASGPTLLLGSDTITTTAAVGYFEGAWSSFTNGGSAVNYDIAGGSPIFTTTVSTFPVHSFYYDTVGFVDTSGVTQHPLFICVSPGNSSTSYHGLYMSEWNSTTWSGWSAQ